MGTSYTIHKKDGLEIELDEMSNEFHVTVTAGAGTSLEEPTSYGPLTPEDAIRMGLECLQTASYWCSEEEFRRVAQEWASKNSYGADVIYRMVSDD